MIRELYVDLLDADIPFLTTDLATAELVKVSANAFLATKISFINAVAEVCEAAGADVTQLADALGYDARIGRRFLNAGVGFGGGCLPKDIRAFMARAGELGAEPALSFLREVDNINMRRRAKVVELAAIACGGSLLGANRLDGEATDDELANESGIPAEKIADLLDHSRDPVSLDMPVGSDEEAPLGDFIEDAEATSAESAVIAGLMHTDVRAVLATLDEREQQVIRMRYGLDDGQPRTLDQIGRMFGLSRERVRQIEREVMGKLRQGERAERLRAYAS